MNAQHYIDDKLNHDVIILRKHLKKVNRQEKYYFYEKDYGRIVYFADIPADKTIDKSSFVVDTIIKNNLHKALMKALDTLNENEMIIIDECFFSEKRPSYEKLAKRHNISRQAYQKRLRRILNKLRLLIDLYNENF